MNSPISPEEIQAYQAKIAELEAQLASKDQTVHWQQQYISALEEERRLHWLRRFGAQSEKLAVTQLGMFNESEDTLLLLEEQEENSAVPEPTTAEPTPKKQPGRPALPEHLPRTAVVYEVAEEERLCPHDGTLMTEIGEEISEQLRIIPAQIEVIQHRRKKYACSSCQQHLITAPKPAQPIPKSIASAEVLATVATSKYADGVPLYRQVKQFERIGVTLSRSTLARWMVKSGELIQPLINRLQEHVLEQPVVHLDETPVQVLKEPGKPAQSQSYMWVQAAGPPEREVILFHYDPSRSQQVPQSLLLDYCGALMVDGYEGYNAVCINYNLPRLGCWAHARRKFVEAHQVVGKKKKSGHAYWMLNQIQQLYKLEKQLKAVSDEERHRQRQAQAVPILDKIHAWLENLHPQVPPKSALGKALHYLHHQWERLIRYVEDGSYPIDNNRVENAIRPFALGRKNWLFATSQAGAKASANLYSLIETAKRNGLEPYAYLVQVFSELPKAQTLKDIDTLLPWHISITA